MHNFDDYPKIRNLEPEFPYLIQDPSRDATSYVSIVPVENDYKTVADQIFIIAGASIEQHSNSYNSESVITLNHSFGYDFEGSKSKLASLTLKTFSPLACTVITWFFMLG